MLLWWEVRGTLIRMQSLGHYDFVEGHFGVGGNIGHNEVGNVESSMVLAGIGGGYCQLGGW